MLCYCSCCEVGLCSPGYMMSTTAYVLIQVIVMNQDDFLPRTITALKDFTNHSIVPKG